MRVACVQSHVVFADPTANADNAIRHLENLKAQDIDLVVFPEAYLTGYCVGSRGQAEQIAIEATADASREFNRMHPSLMRLYEASERLDIGCVVGFAGNNGMDLYNGVALFEPGRPARRFMKVHMPCLGFDRFAIPGSNLDVFDTKWGTLGILICFDQRPPEAARTLALKGAEIILLPTNWPIGAEVSAMHMSIARAAENKVFLATCNRVGIENGTTFIGQSKIIDTRGRVLAAAGDGEEILIADLDLSEAREKRIVNIPGEYEMEVFDCRRPELYTVITTPNR